MVRLRPPVLFASLTLLAAAACADSSPPENAATEWLSEREERGDTTIVRTLEGSVRGDTMRLVPEVAIGVLDGDSAYTFGQIAGLEVGAAGRILVTDRQAGVLRIFSADGAHVQTIGRTGDGPGEFRRPDHVRVAPDGRIVVRSQAAGLSIFSPEGTYLAGAPFRSGFGTNAPFHLDSAGNVLHPTFIDRLVRYSLEGEALDTVKPPTRGHEPRMMVIEKGPMLARYGIPFTPSEHWTIAAAGETLFGFNDRYAIERWGPGGRVLRIERRVGTVPVDEAERSDHHERLARTARDEGVSVEIPEIPSVKPPFSMLLPGRDGSIWVFRHTPSVREENAEHDPANPMTGPAVFWREERIADVFDGDGRYLGPVVFPREVEFSTPPVLTADAVVAATMHPQGYPQVVRYRMEGSGAD